MVDGRPVETAALLEAAGTIRRTVAAGCRSPDGSRTDPTFFEVTTAIAFELFRRAARRLRGPRGRAWAAGSTPPTSPRRSPRRSRRSTSTTSGSSASTIARHRGREGRDHQARHARGRRRDQARRGGGRSQRRARERGAMLMPARDGVSRPASASRGTGWSWSSRRRRRNTRPCRSHCGDATRSTTRSSPSGCSRSSTARGSPSAAGSDRAAGLDDGAVARAPGPARGRSGTAGPLRCRPQPGRRARAGRPTWASSTRAGSPIVFGIMRDKDVAGTLAPLLPFARPLDPDPVPGPTARCRSTPWDRPRGTSASDRRSGRADPQGGPRARVGVRRRSCCVAGSIFLVGDVLADLDRPAVGTARRPALTAGSPAARRRWSG